MSIFTRNLRLAGLIPTTGRGSSAAQMTEREAAIILLSISITDKPSLAVEAVQRFGDNRYSRAYSDMELDDNSEDIESRLFKIEGIKKKQH